MKRRQVVCVVGAGLLAVSAVWVGARHLASGSTSMGGGAVPQAVVIPLDAPTTAPADGRDAVAVAAGESWGVATGYPDTAGGARSAAVGWVSALGPLMRMGPIATDETLRALMTASAASATITSFRDERTKFAKQFGADPINALWADIPLTVTTVDHTSEHAVIRVWSQLVMGVPTGTVEALWRTQTITLVWQNHDWRVDDIARVEGPTPDVDPTAMPSPGTEIAPVLGWTPALLAGASVRGDG